jgi:hypothetical protein
MRICLCLLCVAVALALPIPAKAICGVPQPRLVCAEYFSSQLIVEATLVGTTEMHDKDDPEGVSAYLYILRVKRALRGKMAGAVRVYEGNDSGRATFDWVPGREYLLFLSYAANEKSWELDGCGNSGPISKAGMALSEIAAIKAARGGGVIHGVARGSEQLPFTTIPGVHVEAQGTTGRHSATTNEKGEFQIDVTAGRYVVRVVDGGLFFDRALFSYEDPRRIQIEPGSCAQIELAEVGRPPAR